MPDQQQAPKPPIDWSVFGSSTPKDPATNDLNAEPASIPQQQVSAPVEPQPKQSRQQNKPPIDWSVFGSSEAAKPAQSMPAPSLEQTQKPTVNQARIDPSKNTTPWYAKNFLQMAGGPTMLGLYDKLIKDPRAEGKDPGYLAQLAYEMSKWPAEIVDGILTPSGAAQIAGLTALHLIPGAQPFAFMLDAALGARQVMQTGGDVVNLFKDDSPQNVADTLKDAAMSFVFLKGAGRGMKKLGRPGGEEAADVIGQRADDVTQILDDLAPKYGDKARVKAAKRASQLGEIEQAKVPASKAEEAWKNTYKMPDTLGTIFGKKIPNVLKPAQPIVDFLGKATGAVPMPTTMRMAANWLNEVQTKKNFYNKINDTIHSSMEDSLGSDNNLLKIAEVIQDPASVGMSNPDMMSRYGISQAQADAVELQRLKNRGTIDDTKIRVTDPKTIDGVEYEGQRYQGDLPYMDEAHGRTVPRQDNVDTYLHQAWDFDKTNARFDSIMQDYRNGTSAADIARKLGVSENGVQAVIDSGGEHIGPDGGKATDRIRRGSQKDTALKKRRYATAFDESGTQKEDTEGTPLGPRSYKEGTEDYLWVPKYDKFTDVLRARSKTMVEAAENHRAYNKLIDRGLLRNAKNAPANWPDAPGTEKMQFTGKVEGGKTRAGVNKPDTNTMVARPMKVDPDFYPATELMNGVGSGYRDPVTGELSAPTKLEQARVYSKGIATMGTLFHNWSITSQYLGESAANASPRNIVRSAFFLNPEWYKSTLNETYKAFGGDKDLFHTKISPEIGLDYVHHGGTLSSPDLEGPVNKYLMDINKSGIAASAKRVAGNALNIFNKPTFDVYLTDAKLNTYHSILMRELKRLGPDATESDIANLKKTAADHVERQFSSESMSKLMLSPATQKVMNWSLFAPTWALGNVRQLTAGWENAVGRSLKTRSLAGAAVSWWLATNLANYASTAWDDKDHKGHFTWDNPGLPAKIAGKTYPFSENAGAIYDGKNEDGSQRYLTFGKPKMDGFAWLQDPWGTILTHAHPLAKAAMEEITGYSPGSDYKVIKGPAQGATSAETATQRIGVAAQPFVPFQTAIPGVGEHGFQKLERAVAPRVQPQTSDNSSLTALPATKGATYEKMVGEYTSALRKVFEDGDSSSINDDIQRLTKAGLANNVDMKSVQQRAMGNIRERMNTERGSRAIMINKAIEQTKKRIGQSSPPPGVGR